MVNFLLFAPDTKLLNYTHWNEILVVSEISNLRDMFYLIFYFQSPGCVLLFKMFVFSLSFQLPSFGLGCLILHIRYSGNFQNLFLTSGSPQCITFKAATLIFHKGYLGLVTRAHEVFSHILFLIILNVNLISRFSQSTKAYQFHIKTIPSLFYNTFLRITSIPVKLKSNINYAYSLLYVFKFLDQMCLVLSHSAFQ